MLSLCLTLPISLLAIATTTLVSASPPSLTQQQQQLLHDRLFQTNLRGPRWTGNENHNTLTTLVSRYMALAGLEVDTLNYTLQRWDPRWWSLTLNLKNGTALGLPTTGYWPYSGNSGLEGVTAPVHDAGSFVVIDDLDPSGDPSSLNLDNLQGGGSVVFFDNPSPTRNYSHPLYQLMGTSRNISTDQIPELGNLSNPHWQSTKVLNFTDLQAQGVSAMIASWTDTSDEDATLQFLPNDGAPGAGSLFHVPTVYVGNTTGETIRQLSRDGEVDSATVTLYAPTIESDTHTVIGHLEGTSGKNDTIIVYTHSDGPSIVEENGPILLLTMAETLARQKPSINIDFVITTGHMSGGHLSETRWMSQRPDIQKNAKAAIVCEHFGALEFKDDFSTGVPVYKATGNLEPMWTMANDSSASHLLHQHYLDAFQGTSDSLRMALLAPQTVDDVRAHWYGAGGSSNLGRSSIPTVGIIPQPDYLWAAMVDGGWSKLDIPTAVEQINVILRLITSLDESYVAGQL